jgi:folate-binding protein YgfZ
VDVNAASDLASSGHANLWFRRPERTRLLFQGRSPGRMLLGLVTGTVGGDPKPLLATDASAAWLGALHESLVLTPKGRIVTDLRLALLESGESGAFFADLPAAGEAPLLEHLRQYLPPRFARAEVVTDRWGMVTIAGPDALSLAAALISDDPAVAGAAAAALGQAVPAEGGAAAVPLLIRRGGPGESGAPDLLLFRSNAVATPAVDVVASPAVLAAWVAAIEARGIREGSSELWTAWRVAHGFPETGAELDDTVLPPEAGLERRAIDHRKGCYTGQEVIVRIRDRGHVNRHLRQLWLLRGTLPGSGTPLYRLADGKEVGVIRTVVPSPATQGGGLALAYVRREIKPGDQVQVGEDPDCRAEVRVPPFQMPVSDG